ncbi:DUF928 domain-containing protein [Nostoc sp. FACHB-152]|uniref:DUF928 domain-containing protein n=1 Tax=Nostoc sp. FACHB-152 TaxID=2692837 RepID=UPI001687C446|nr:DUF928 domain-containing protein [Nostoc sp. FACHB-152]MBD2448125.1 DUF928 domain-containing protein [Nostoc sp. FACHB-152]
MLKIQKNPAFISLLMVFSTISQPVLAQVRFKPPSTKAPGVSQSGGTRGECIAKTQRELQFVKALLPKENFGLTTAANPTLMVYVPKSTAKSLDIELRSLDKKQVLLKQNLPVPVNNSIVRINLRDPKIPQLELNKNYYWKVTLVCPSKDNDAGGNSFAEGWIQRIQPDAKLQAAISKATPQTLPSIYAEAGIWLDALISLDTLFQQQPHNRLLTFNWKSFLKSGEVNDAIASIPIVK